MLYVFGNATLDTQQYELRCAGALSALRLKAFDLLVYLIEHRDRVVSRDEVFNDVWRDPTINSTTLDACIMEARQAVGDNGHGQHVIRTVRGRGYRFVAAVEVREHPAQGDITQAIPAVVRPYRHLHLDQGENAPVTALVCPQQPTTAVVARNGPSGLGYFHNNGDASGSCAVAPVVPRSAWRHPPTNVLQPFVAGPPLTQPRHFFGRVHELTRLFHLWQRLPHQNAAIIGPRHSGKTSLLRYLQHITTTPPDQLRPGQRGDWLRVPAHYRWIFVDFHDPRLGSREGLLRYLLTCLGLPIPRPCTLGHVLDVLSDHVQSPTVILLDDIGVALQRYPELDDTFWEGLRALATNEVGGNVAFVLAARESPEHLARSCGLSSSFFNIFGYTATLGPLTEPEARELLASSLDPMSTVDADWILEHSGRWPLALQLLCRERLAALETGETEGTWREEGLRQLAACRNPVRIP